MTALRRSLAIAPDAPDMAGTWADIRQVTSMGSGANGRRAGAVGERAR